MVINCVPDWPICSADGCIGVRWKTSGQCLRHLLAADRDRALAKLRPGVELDARGVVLDRGLLDEILGKLPEKEGRKQIGARFDCATFTEAVSFSHLKFTSTPNFYCANFQATADFDGAVFGGETIFFGAIFDGEAIFGGTLFENASDFTHAEFKGGANFYRATFTGKSTFYDARFAGVTFDRATFEKEVSFVNAKFEPVASIGNDEGLQTSAVGDATPPYTTFNGAADFENAGFGDASHFYAMFKRAPNFTKATLGKQTRFRVKPCGDIALEGAAFVDAHLEGVDLSDNVLAGINLTGATLDFQTKLKSVRLLTRFNGSPPRKRTRLADVRWNSALITGVLDWEKGSPRLGEDPYPEWPLGLRLLCLSFGRAAWKLLRNPRLTSKILGNSFVHPIRFLKALSVRLSSQISDSVQLAAAIVAYRQIIGLLRDQGMIEASRHFAYRERQLARRQMTRFQRFGSWLWDAVSGYGYRPGRILMTYVVIVLGFAAIYMRYGATTDWGTAIWLSIIAFHGRGFGNTSAARPDLAAQGIESVLGLLVEAVLVATLIRRLFRD